jgi:lipopolysaccharide transport system permease protein
LSASSEGSGAPHEEPSSAVSFPSGAGGTELRYFGQSPRWRLVSWRELWRHREMLWVMGLRDLKVRYRQTLVGVSWVVLHPLAMGIVLVLFFSRLGARPSSGSVPYPLMLLSGLVLWQLFAGIVSRATGSLVGNQHLIKKAAFPRLILPLATVLTGLVDFSVGLLLPAGLMAYYGIAPGWGVVLLPAFVLLAVTAALALGIWFSALNAMYRDAAYLVTVLLQIGFFTSPVMYTTGAVIPEQWRPVVALNPMVGPLEGIRWSLFGGEGRWLLAPVLTSVVVTSVIFVTGLAYFRRVEGVVADRI